MNYTNFLQFNDKKFNKWLIVLIVVLAVMIIAAVILVLVINKEKKALDDINTEQNGIIEEELIKYGKMSLQTLAEDVVIGETITIDILMDTQNSNIVVASAYIIYDSEILELIVIDSKDSVLSMSIMKEEKIGKIEIVRGAPGDADYDDNDDGYTGSDGVMASLEFKALKSPSAGSGQAGQTEIEFNQQDSNMILDDGRGTGMVVEYNNLILDIN